MADRKPYANQDVESAALDIEDEIRQAFKALRRELVRELSALEQEDGAVVRSSVALAKVRNLMLSLRDRASELGLSKVAARMADRLAGLAESVAGEQDLTPAEERAATASIEPLKLLLFGAQRQVVGIEQGVARELEDVIYRSIVGAVKFGDLLDAIETRLELSEAQAVTLLTSTLSSFHTLSRVTRYGQPGPGGEPIVKWWAYEGPEDDRTRDFCGHCVGLKFTLEGLDALDGMWGRQHPLPPHVSLGGYNCRHELVPLPGDSADDYETGPR